MKIPAKDYHANPAISRSALEKIRKSPKHLRHYLDNGVVVTDPMRLGTLVHTLVLEPELFEAEYAMYDGVRNKKHEKYQKFLAENPGKEIIKPAEFNLANCIADAFRSHPLTKGLLDNASVEESFFWKDQMTGVECKARTDIILGDTVFDLKTTSKALTPHEVATTASYGGFRRQAAWYLKAATHGGHSVRDFCFIMVEVEAPYGIRIFKADDAFIELGARENNESLALYAECLEKNDWPGYEPVIETLKLPKWEAENVAG